MTETGLEEGVRTLFLVYLWGCLLQLHLVCRSWSRGAVLHIPELTDLVTNKQMFDTHLRLNALLHRWV